MRPSSVLASCQPSGREEEEEDKDKEREAVPVCVAGVLLVGVIAVEVEVAGEEEVGPAWTRLATAAARVWELGGTAS